MCFVADENMRVKNIINKLYQNTCRAPNVERPSTIDISNMMGSTANVPTQNHLLDSPSSARNFFQQSTTFHTLQPLSPPKTTSKVNFGKIYLNSAKPTLPKRGGSEIPVFKSYKKIVTPS